MRVTLEGPFRRRPPWHSEGAGAYFQEAGDYTDGFGR